MPKTSRQNLEKLRTRIDTETALKNTRQQILCDFENFSSKPVIESLLKNKNEMTWMIASWREKKSKIWKPDKFSFGKKKGGKGTGLASIVDLV